MNTENIEAFNEIYSPSTTAVSFPNAVDDGAGVMPLLASAPSLSAAALSVRDGLRQKLDAAKSALDELDSDRKALAFEAHVSGADAKAKLTALNKRRVLLVADIEMLEVAISPRTGKSSVRDPADRILVKARVFRQRLCHGVSGLWPRLPFSSQGDEENQLQRVAVPS